jgi:hypothetical protein
MTSLERYVPVGAGSLSSDAPGWISKADESESEQSGTGSGPTCWKCKGRQKVVDKKKKSCAEKLDENGKLLKKLKTNTTVCVGIGEGKDSDIGSSKKILKDCPVCDGKGFIPPKKKEMSSLCFQPGMITRKRKHPQGWKSSGPIAHAVDEMEQNMSKGGNLNSSSKNRHPLSYLHEANSMETNDAGVPVPAVEYKDYPWFPSNKGEQMCNLVGSWRILQRVGSHRWTTDDIVTAYIAIQEIMKEVQHSPNKSLKYLDLGCGNGSVLQMTSWGLLDKFDLKAYGIEARSEAAGFARRSLSFNIGKDSIGSRISVIRGDFRDLERNMPFDALEGDNDVDQLEDFFQTKSLKFDLVTGTPPYFQVDFNTEDKNVTSAIINQGGMPTSIQSAPGKKKIE